MTWRATGEFTSENARAGGAARSVFQYAFTIAIAHPNLMRLDITHPGYVRSICDGTTGWTYVQGMKQYTRAASTSAPACTEIPRPAEYLLDGLKTAVVGSVETLSVDYKSINCRLIVGTYDHIDDRAWAPIAPQHRTGPLTRTMCIDPDRLLLLRDRIVHEVDSKSHVDMTTYTTVEENPTLPPDTFQFSPPPNSTEAHEFSLIGPLQITDRVLPPKLVHSVPPKYTEKARKARIEGTVYLYVVVDEAGIPRNMKVVHSLDPGLDQKAMEAVSEWRFKPGTKDGRPVAVSAQVQVNFRLISR